MNGVKMVFGNFDFKSFWGRNKGSVIRTLLLVLVVFLLCFTVRSVTVSTMQKEFDIKLAEAKEQAASEATAQMVNLYGTEEDNSLRATIASEAKILAKMLYPMQYNTDAGLKSACWCAINRVDNKIYPDTIQEVCEQPAQWMGWSEDNPVVQRLYDIAYEQLALWHDGVHAIGLDYVFLEWSSKEIVLKTSFQGRGHFWHEEDWDRR